MSLAPDRGVVPRYWSVKGMDHSMNVSNSLDLVLHYARGVVPPTTASIARTTSTKMARLLHHARGLVPPHYFYLDNVSLVYRFPLGGDPPRDVTVGRPLAHMCLGPRGGVCGARCGFVPILAQDTVPCVSKTLVHGSGARLSRLRGLLLSFPLLVCCSLALRNGS